MGKEFFSINVLERKKKVAKKGERDTGREEGRRARGRDKQEERKKGKRKEENLGLYLLLYTKINSDEL